MTSLNKLFENLLLLVVCWIVAFVGVGIMARLAWRLIVFGWSLV